MFCGKIRPSFGVLWQDLTGVEIFGEFSFNVGFLWNFSLFMFGFALFFFNIYIFLISNVNIIDKAQMSTTLIQRIYKRNPYGIYKEHIFKNSSIIETSIR